MPTRGKRLIAVDGRIEIEDVTYADPGPGQVLVRVTKSQVSAGSEKGQAAARSSERRPLGYTTVGRVVEAGEGMESFRPGDRVFTFGYHGTHWVSEREDNPGDPIHIQRITHDITDEQAAMSRLGDVALHGVRRAELQIDEKAAVFGAGIVGQLAVAFCRLSGAYPVIAVDLDDARLELALRSGATHTVNAARDDAAEAVKEITGGGAEAVFHANRDPDVLGDCMRAAAEHGKVVLVGSPPGTAHLGLQVDLLRRELDVRGSYGNVHDAHRYYRWTQRRDREAIMRMVESEDLAVDHLISHVADPADADDLYRKIVEGPAGWMGIFFDWTLGDQPRPGGS